MTRKRVTQADVAQRAGVSQAAVSQILGGQPDEVAAFRDSTRQKVLQAAQELGYAPSMLARALRTGNLLDAALAGAAGGLTQYFYFAGRIAPLVLRRTKDLVADELPPKQEQVLRVPLAPGHRRLPSARLHDEHRVRRRLAGARPAMLADDEELRNRPVHGKAGVGMGVDQHEADRATLALDQERVAIRIPPVAEILERIGFELAVGLQFASRRPRPVLREVVDVELHEIVEDRPVRARRRLEHDRTCGPRGHDGR